MNKNYLSLGLKFCFLLGLASCTPRILSREEVVETRKPDGSWEVKKHWEWKPVSPNVKESKEENIKNSSKISKTHRQYKDQ